MPILARLPLAAAAALAAAVAPTGHADAASVDNRWQHEQFEVHIDISALATTSEVVAEGPIAGRGTVEIVTSTETATSFHEDELWHFDDRSVELATIGVTTAATFDAATCTSNQHFAGTFRVVAGTGAYTGITGHGHFAGTSTTTYAPAANSGTTCSDDPIAVHIDGAGRGQLRGPRDARRRPMSRPNSTSAASAPRD
jgi:hypothetical protein